MKKYKADEKKVHIYPIQDDDGTELDLMNVLTYKNGKLDRVDTFIGHNERFEYISVGRSKGWAEPGVMGNYSSYVREQEYLLGAYLDAYHKNLGGKRYGSSNKPFYVI